MPQPRRQTPVLIFSAIAVVAIIAAIVFVNRLNSDAQTQEDKPQQADNSGENISLTVNGKDVDDEVMDHTGTPEELVGHISEIVIKASDTGDIRPLIDLIGKNKLSPTQVSHLQKLANNSRLKLNQQQPFSAVEGTEYDWSLNLADQERILLKLAQDAKGSWQVDGITLPANERPKDDPMASKSATKTAPDQPVLNKELTQATATVQAFLDAIVQLDPTAASAHVDASLVSYTTLAGLCILFEEGKYQLAKEKAVRNMFLGNTASGWVIRIQTPDSEKSAMFALSAKRLDQNSKWLITEVNLDKLLSDYASRLSGGDIHYVPIIKNLRGGDSLVLFFKLDSNEITRRTQRQLMVVAKLLKSASDKKLTISGHTDALGSDSYNLKLSRERAEAVKSYLISQGVQRDQIEITSHGKSQPRRPNTTDDGRRANRRAEILLDF